MTSFQTFVNNLLPFFAYQSVFLTKSTRKLRILCLHGFRQNPSSFKGTTASRAKKLKNIAEFVFTDAPHELSFVFQYPLPSQISEPISHRNPPPSENCNRKFAWLVASDYNAESGAEWKMAKTAFDPLQYQQQTKGFEKSVDYLNTIFSDKGPFDGIMGFSQGAAMASFLGAHKRNI